MEDFDFINILKQKRVLKDSNSLTRDAVQSSLDFLLIWAYFETILNNKSSYQDIDKGFKKVKNIDNETKKQINIIYNKLLEYKPHVDNLNYSILLNDVDRDNISIKFVFNDKGIYKQKFKYIKDKLNRENSELEKLKILVYLSKIIRNQMFHGAKELPEFWSQNSLISLFAFSIKIFTFDIGLYIGIMND